MAGSADARGIKEAAVIVAHADDETLGCGGYIPLLIKQGVGVHVVIASDGMVKARGSLQANRPPVMKAMKLLGVSGECLHFLDLEDQKFEKYLIADVVNKIKLLPISPDLIITHVASDLNNDHKFIHQCALIYGRSVNKQVKILGCDVPNTTEWAGARFNARYYVDISRTLSLKQRAFACYANEVREFPHPWSMKGLEVLAQQRGMEVGLKCAEAYDVIRWFA